MRAEEVRGQPVVWLAIRYCHSALRRSRPEPDQKWKVRLRCASEQPLPLHVRPKRYYPRPAPPPRCPCYLESHSPLFLQRKSLIRPSSRLFAPSAPMHVSPVMRSAQILIERRPYYFILPARPAGAGRRCGQEPGQAWQCLAVACRPCPAPARPTLPAGRWRG